MLGDVDRPNGERPSFVEFDDVVAMRRYLRIVHHVPGRLRVRLSKGALRASSGVSLSEFRQLFEQFDDVQLSISKATLSAVLEYDPDCLTPGLWDRLLGSSDDDARSAFEALMNTAKG